MARRFDGPKTAVADQHIPIDLEEVGEELEGDHVDDVLQRCEAISQSLKSVLGGSLATDRVSSLEAPPIVSHEALIEACGNAARYLKRCRKNPMQSDY